MQPPRSSALVSGGLTAIQVLLRQSSEQAATETPLYYAARDGAGRRPAGLKRAIASTAASSPRLPRSFLRVAPMSRPTDILGARSPMLQQMSGMPEQVTVPPASRRPSPDSDSDEDDDGDDDQTFVASTSIRQATPSTGSSAPAKAPPITSSASRKARKKRERACDWCRHRKIKRVPVCFGLRSPTSLLISSDT